MDSRYDYIRLDGNSDTHIRWHTFYSTELLNHIFTMYL